MHSFTISHIPLSVISDPYFRRLLLFTRNDLKLPSRSTVQRLLMREYQLAVKAIATLIPMDRKISIAIDAWTSPNKLAILSIIGYFVTSDWRLAEIQLGFEQIQGEHNGENLAAVIMDVLHRYMIDDGRLLGITTDNASSNFTTSDSLQAALNLIGVKWSAWNNHMPCMAHVIQLSLGAFMKELKIGGREKFYVEQVFRQEDSEGGKKSKIEKFLDLPKGFGKIVEKVRTMRLAFS